MPNEVLHSDRRVFSWYPSVFHCDNIVSFDEDECSAIRSESLWHSFGSKSNLFVFHGSTIETIHEDEYVTQCSPEEVALLTIYTSGVIKQLIDTEESKEQIDYWYNIFQSQAFHYNVVQHDEIHFNLLVEKWRSERGATSSVSEMILCPSYLAIIGMGERVLPLILAQIRREGDDPDHWSAALRAITGEDPVSGAVYGDTVRMAEAWLGWAEERHDW